MAIFTIGYGKRTADELLDTLKRYGIDFVVDVRSSPYSSYKPEFSRDAIKVALSINGIRYVYMGDLLGGRPTDADCYIDGKVDYDRLKVTTPFQQGIARLRSAWEQSLHVCLMCSEGRPEECHRSKLIGEVLNFEGIKVQHIDSEGTLRDQQSVLKIITDGQITLFDKSFTSSKRHRIDPT